MHNTEDKQWWVIEWNKKETLFVNEVCPQLNLTAQINPAKVSDPYAPDLMVQKQLADLKCQQTPFYKAKELYGIDSQFAVTFNRKDYLRYCKLYPDIVIYYWLDWQETERVFGGKKYQVKPMWGVWRTLLQTLDQKIKKNAPLHSYQRRFDDTQGNARDSYVFDVRGFECLHFRLEK